MFFKRWAEQFSDDLAIDLGTANTLVFVRGEGIVLNEPSVVAIHEADQSIIAVGREAKAMLGRTPGNIRVIRPLRDGVIADFDITEKMLAYFISQTHRWHRTILRLRDVKGRDPVDGFPKSVVLTEEEVREALGDAGMAIVETVRTCLEQTPPELAADIVDTGIVITGGGGLLRGLDRLLGTETQLPVTVAKDPIACVALGVGRFLNELELLKKVATPA